MDRYARPAANSAAAFVYQVWSQVITTGRSIMAAQIKVIPAIWNKLFCKASVESVSKINGLTFTARATTNKCKIYALSAS